MRQSPSRDRLRTEASIKQALMEGSPYPMLRVTDAKEADTVLSSLQKAAAHNQWLLSLLAADPKRVLRAAGITFEGAAQQALEQKFAWIERPEEFERLMSSSRTALQTRPVLLKNGQTSGLYSGAEKERWQLSTPVGRIESLTQTSYVPVPASQPTGTASPSIEPTEAGYSHATPINYAGTTFPWDAVIQLHESCLRRQYDVLFLSQIGEAIKHPGSPDAVEHTFEFESWLFVFIRCRLTIGTIGDRRRIVTMDGAGHDEVGVRLPFTATTYTRWTPDDDWDEWETFKGTITRYGHLTKESPISLGGQTFRRTWAADLVNGWSVIELDDGPNDSREMIIEGAANAYIASELPLMPVTPTFSVDKPLLTYPNSAAFTAALEPDRKAVSLCFHEDAQTLKNSYPFRHYILDHGRNMAVGISIAALEREVLDGLELPVSADGVTVESVNITGGSGRLHVRSEGKTILGIKFSHTADVLLSLKNGQLTAEVDNSTLNLPWWLWVLNTLLFVPLFGVSGLIPLAITNIVGSKIIGGKLEDLLDLSSLQEMISGSSDDDSIVTTSIERVEVNPFGIFLKGNVEIVIPQVN